MRYCSSDFKVLGLEKSSCSPVVRESVPFLRFLTYCYRYLRTYVYHGTYVRTYYIVRSYGPHRADFWPPLRIMVVLLDQSK